MEVVLHLPVLPNVELVAAKAVETVGGAMGMAASRVEAASVAMVEACLNAIEHGGGPVGGRPSGSRGKGGPRPCIEVGGHGDGFDPARVVRRSSSCAQGCAAKRGWGLTLIRELMDEVDIQSKPGLTLVRMRKYVENG
jgi:anti-sigma regulatory factor (Ser/Thr protein kinase)